MAVAKKCDRCGKYYEPYAFKCNGKDVGGIALTSGWIINDYSSVVFDLCEVCMAKFAKWMRIESDDAKE